MNLNSRLTLYIKVNSPQAWWCGLKSQLLERQEDHESVECLPSVIKALGSSLSTTQQSQLKMDGRTTHNYQPHKTKEDMGRMSLTLVLETL